MRFPSPPFLGNGLNAVSRVLFSALGKWGRTQMGSDGLSRILRFLAQSGYALYLWKHMISRDFGRIVEFGWNLVKNCLTPSSADPIYPVPMFRKRAHWVLQQARWVLWKTRWVCFFFFHTKKTLQLLCPESWASQGTDAMTGFSTPSSRKKRHLHNNLL